MFNYKDVWRKLEPLIGDRYTTEWDKLNYKMIPVTVIEAKIGNEEEYNTIYQMLLNSNFRPIKRTNSGGVSINIKERGIPDKYDVRQLGNVNEITIVTLERSCRIQWRLNNIKTESGEEKLETANSYLMKHWMPTCKKYGIDMSNYKCSKEEGLKYKEEIHKADINIYDGVKGMPMGDINHLDFHKFYMSGLIQVYPEFKPVVEELISKKDKALHKTGLASMIGLFQSPYIQYRYAKLSRDAINTAYIRYDEVKQDLINSGRKIILTNTDGIWYQGDIYHGRYEGEHLTEWSNDHIDCGILIKSKGSYQYMENDKCHTVVRGFTKRDRFIPREEWEWGDIFKEDCSAVMWKFEQGVGIVWQE